MAYHVTVQPSGKQFDCEDDESVLSAGLRHGVTLNYGCRDGACGSCMGKLVTGAIAYPQGTLPPAISQQEAAQGYALFCQARPRADLVIEAKVVEQVGQLRAKTLPVRVRRIERVTDDVIVLFLQLPAGERLQFQAGQWLEFLLKDGSRRAFSIANPPNDDELIELHVRHVEGGRFTEHVFNKLKEGALLRVEGPRGTFVLREDSPRPIVMMAGGTGIAPLKGMIEHAFYIGLDRPMHLFWGVRSRADLYLNDLIEGWAAATPGFRYTPVLSEPREDDGWEGAVGLVHDVLLRTYSDLAGFDVYMAGPPSMIEAARQAFALHGLPDSQLYFDSFEFGADTVKALADLPADPKGLPPT